MLIMFRAKNFASFHNDVIIDMRATNYKEHPSHLAHCCHMDLIKTLAIYGANASGKSNLISALYWFETFVTNQLFTSTKKSTEEEIDNLSRVPLLIEPFLLASSTSNEIEFEMIFSHNEIIYQYGFSFEFEKIKCEWLSVNNERVFDRTNITVLFGNKYKNYLKEYTKLREDRLYLAILDYFSTDIIKELIDGFKEYFDKKFNVFFEFFLDTSVKGFGFSINSEKFLKNDDLRVKVIEYIRKIDLGIVDIEIEKEDIVLRGEKRERVTLKTHHNVFDTKGRNVGTKKFDISKESSGTIRFLSFIQDALTLIENGGVFVVDEISARLHPLLTKYIVDLFQSEVNINNAQLIFTTHDTSLLNKDQFRRDEIAFIEKNDKGESNIFTLADIKVRSDASYAKDYFNGKYGAIPVIHAMQRDGD